ncbi:MAG: PIN domain-containing protein [Thiotrichaceae bacterium]
MSKLYFVDSNIWLYAAITGNEKSESARVLIESKSIVISTQVINEVSFNLLRKYRYSEDEVETFIREISISCHVHLLTIQTCLVASTIRQRYQLSFWDSMIVAAALESQCVILYSEDMQHNQRIEGKLTICNPFS